MTSYFERLGDELRLATARRYAGAGKRGIAPRFPGRRLASTCTGMRPFARRRIGRWPTLALAAVVLAGGSAAAAIPLLAGSHRLAGRVPVAGLHSPAPGSGMPSLSLLAGLRYSVAVFPDLEAGDAGWCSSVTFTLPGASSPIPGGGTCGPADAGAPAITAGGAALANVLAHLPRTYPSGRKPKARSRAQIVAIMNQATQHDVFLNWFVVTDRVAAVKLNGTTVVPRHEQELTSTWRGIAAFTSGIPAKVVYLQHDGRPISPLAGGAPPPSQPTVSVDPRHLRATACGLSGTRLPGLASEWEVIAKTLPAPNSGVGAGVLFSCARAWYAFPRSHAVYSAAILLDAHNVAQRAPRLPGLTPDPHRGDYEEAHDDSAEITARRIGNAWLVVQGPSRRQREALLHDINATGTALHK